ncbi:MAG: ATP-dependent helicase [Acidimicrobiales bacterium]|jgi:DNA helicase-2/ATP-dependent DNA helicase PcrA
MTVALDDLDEEQRAAAAALSGPVCIIAGAGSGKTRTVTHRLAYGVATRELDPRRALAITHSRKAAAELGERLSRLGVGGVDARTFHAAGLWVAKGHWARTGRQGPSPIVLSESEEWRLWRDALRSALGQEPDNAELRDIMDEAGWARSQLVSVEDYSAAAMLAGRRPGVDPSSVVRCWERFNSAKARIGKVDFADLLEIASGLIEGDEPVALAVRHRWAHVTVDEYQDTDPAQQRLLDAILGDGRDVCVVGDPRQAIYSWKGADPVYLTGFTRRYPDAQVFNLTRNYRSSPQILDWANRVARGGQTKPLVATRDAGARPKITQLDDEQGEAAWVAGAARRAIASGAAPSEIAVLYRFNSTQARFEAAFARADIAVVVAEDTTFFDREEVRAVLVPFGREARAQPERSGLELLSSLLVRAGFDRDKPPSGLGAARARWESQQALVELVEALPGAATAGARSLLAEVNSLAVRTHGPRTSGVTLATLHKAKGLEWDIVFVVGMTDGAMPSVYAESDAELAEEERLLHVGVTRARRELHLTWATSNARGWTNHQSPFLDRFATTTQQRRERLATPTQQRRGQRSERPQPEGKAVPATTAQCPHCAGPLKGIAARRLGVCAHCVLSVPGQTGEMARALASVVNGAAGETGLASDDLVTDAGMLRLLAHRPESGDEVAATPGVGLRGSWAQAAAEVLTP